MREESITEKIDNFAIGSILYFTLSGTLPFNSYDLSGILQKTLEGAYALNDKRWKMVSEEAKDLVVQLLEGDPNDRITLDDALKHPWFNQVKQRKSSLSLTASTRSLASCKGKSALLF